MGISGNKTVVESAAPSPGQRLHTLLQELGMKQTQLAALLGRTPQYVQDVIKGKKAMDARVAVELEEALGTPLASNWLMWELEYQKSQMRQELAGKTDSSIKRKDVVEKYPFALDAIKFGWISDSRDPATLQASIESYLGQVSSPAFQGQMNYRTSGALAMARNSLTAWSVQCFVRARELDKTDALPKFVRAAIPSQLIPALQAQMGSEEAVAAVPEILRRHGIRFMIVPSLRKAPVDGLASYNNGHPFIALSLRHGQIDRFWFVLFHELAHLYKDHRPEEMEYNSFDHRVISTPQEQEADDLAMTWLMDADKFSNFVDYSTLSMESIRAFAEEIGRHPAIILGRLKRDGYIPWTMHAREHVSIRDNLAAV